MSDPKLKADKYFCAVCDWRGTDEQYLKAKNPFDPSGTIVGCPECKEVETMVMACDEPDCWKQVNCGFPTDSGGYRRTCDKHFKAPPANVSHF